MVIKVHSGIGKGGKNNDLFVIAVDRMLNLVFEYRKQFLELAIVLGGDVIYHKRKKL